MGHSSETVLITAEADRFIEGRICFFTQFDSLHDSSTSMNRLDIKLKDHEHPCDVTLVVKDGKEFQAHRSVLSQASSFFEKLLNSEMKESNKGVIRLEIVSESQMAGILEFIYTGSVQISTRENAENLIELADYLVLPNLKALAGKCLEVYITTSNCISMYYEAEKFLCQGLIARCRKAIHTRFASVAKSDDFLNLSSQEAEKWISSDEIVIDAEEKKKKRNFFLDTIVYKGDRFLKEFILDVRTSFKPTKIFQYTNFYSCRLQFFQRN